MKVYSVLFCTLLGICAVKGQIRMDESPRLVHNRIMVAEREQAKLFNKMYDQKGEIEKKMEFFKNYRSNLQGLYGLGKVEKLEVRAERYENEKTARETIEEEVKKLLAMMETLDVIQRKTAADRKLYSLQAQVMDLKGIDDDDMGMPGHERELLYYEVQMTSTFKEISTLKEVYGDPDSWRYLYEANKDKFKDPMALIPKGTELVVPNIKVVEAIDISGGE